MTHVPRHRDDGTIKISIAGGSFRKQDFLGLHEGTVLRLEKEPSNSFDRYAIKLITEDGRHVGYVANSHHTVHLDALSASSIYERIDDRTTAIVVWINKEIFKATGIINFDNEYLLKFLEKVPLDELALNMVDMSI